MAPVRFRSWRTAPKGICLPKNNGDEHGSTFSTPWRDARHGRPGFGRRGFVECGPCGLYGSRLVAPAERCTQILECRVSPLIGCGLGDERVRGIRVDRRTVEN